MRTTPTSRPPRRARGRPTRHATSAPSTSPPSSPHDSPERRDRGTHEHEHHRHVQRAGRGRRGRLHAHVHDQRHGRAHSDPERPFDDVRARSAERSPAQRDVHGDGGSRRRDGHGRGRPAGQHGRGRDLQLQHDRSHPAHPRHPGPRSTSRPTTAASSPRFRASSPPSRPPASTCRTRSRTPTRAPRRASSSSRRAPPAVVRSASRCRSAAACRSSGRAASPSCAPTASGFDNLTTTEIVTPTVVPGGPGRPSRRPSSGWAAAFRRRRVIDNDSPGDVETSNTFDVAAGRHRLLREPRGHARADQQRRRDRAPERLRRDLGARRRRRSCERPGDCGIDDRGGIVVRENDFNPERMILDDVIRPTPWWTSATASRRRCDAVVDYAFGNFKLLVINDLTRRGRRPGPGSRRGRQRSNELAVATFNVENLDPTDPPAKFARAGRLMVHNLQLARPDRASRRCRTTPGRRPAPSTRCSLSWQLLIAAIAGPGGPTYEYRQIDPRNNAGRRRARRQHPGGLPVPHRPRTGVRRPAGRRRPSRRTRSSTRRRRRPAALQPGRIDPTNPAFANSRKPLAGEFRWRGRHALRDRQPLQLQGRRRSAVRALPAADPKQRGAAAPAGGDPERLRRQICWTQTGRAGSSCSATSTTSSSPRR